MPKHIQDIASIQNIRTLRGERMGSIPKDRRSLFLELYLQEKEKERLSAEIEILKKKLILNNKKLGKTLEHINRTRNEINAKERKINSGNGKVVSSFKVGRRNKKKMKSKRRK